MAEHGHHHCDSEEGDAAVPSHNGDSASPDSNSHEHAGPSQCNKRSDQVSERHGCSDGQMSANRRDEDRLSGDGSNGQNYRKGSHPQAKAEENQDKGCFENDREQQEPAVKQTRKARKPDQEFYQPGSRRNIQGKESGAGPEQDKPPRRKPQQKTESESPSRMGEKKGIKNPSTPKQRGKENEDKGNQEKVNVDKASETNRKQQKRDAEKPPLPSDVAVEKITTKVEKLSMREEGKEGGVAQDVEEAGCRRWETTDKGLTGHTGGRGTKEEEEKTEKKMDRGNRKKRAGERAKEGNQDSRRGRAESGRGKSDSGSAEKEKDRRAADADRDNKPAQPGETNQSKGRTKQREREYRRESNNNNRSRENEKPHTSERNVVRAVEVSDRIKSSANITTPTSKRYSKSDIRRSRNRTYSSSSASSVTSSDCPGRGMDGETTTSLCSELPRKNDTGVPTRGREGGRTRLQFNGESSTESMEGSEMSDIAEDRIRRRRNEGEELSTERQRDERNRSRVQKGVGRGILKVSLEKQPSKSLRNEDAKYRKQGMVSRARGGGILVLPSRTDISNSAEFGSRLLFGGIRGGSAGRGRGGRGGGMRRLWDPNNPDQKPALTSTQSSQHSSLQQPMYLQSGTGYGQLHFLDTDDEVTGSPPVPHGEHFRSQQQAAMAFYKFQNSDNPYCYPIPPNSPHNPTTTTQRYPYPYHMTTYQMTPPNGIYQGPGMGQMCGSYRGAGYTQPGAGGSLTPEEVEQQARGELGRLLRAADAQELQLSNLLSRDRLSADGLDRMAQLR